MALWSELFSPKVARSGVFHFMDDVEYSEYEAKILDELSDEMVAEILDPVDYHDSRVLGMTHAQAIEWNKDYIKERGES